MKNKHIETPPFGAGQLRVLLTLSRDLLQTDEASGSLALVGRTLVDMVQPSSALLLVRGDLLNVVAFDRHGSAQAAGSEHALYEAGMAVLAAPAGALTQDERNARQTPAAPHTLVLAAPAHGAMAVLAVAWEHALSSADVHRYERALMYVLQLTAAALGRIEAHGALAQRAFDQHEELLNSSVAHAAELARRDEAAAEMRMLSVTDVLTGLYNRRGFFLQAEQVYRLARRNRTPSAVIFADIDGLKRVNDELGHELGDRLLQDAARLFRLSFRDADVLARLGGDEFVAYTLGDERPEMIIDRLQSKLRAFNLLQERPYAVSISAGLVQCDAASEHTLSHYVMLADEQMYVQKRRRLH